MGMGNSPGSAHLKPESCLVRSSLGATLQLHNHHFYAPWRTVTLIEKKSASSTTNASPPFTSSENLQQGQGKVTVPYNQETQPRLLICILFGYQSRVKPN